MSGGGDGLDDNDMAGVAWPGFVDILSSVIIMFVFFVMVITIVLYMYTISFTEKIQETAMQEAMQSIVEEDYDRIQDRKTLIEEIEELKVEKERIEQEIESFQSEFNQTTEGFAESNIQNVISEEETFVVLFEKNAVTLTPETVEAVTEFLNKFTNESISNILVEAGDSQNEMTVIADRRQSLGRMLNVRNIALSSGYESDSIEMKYSESQQINGNENWVRITIK